MNRRTFFGAASLAVAPMTVTAIYDPLLDTITEYRKQIALFNAIPDGDLTKENEASYVASTYEPAMRKLLYDTPPTTSLEGVREALRLAFKEDAFSCRLSENALRSALTFLEAA